MKKLVLVFLAVFVSVFAFSQEKIRYGNIPYGISIEEAVGKYKPLYNECKEETSSFDCTFIDFTALRPMFQNIFGNITTFSRGYTSAWTPFDKNITRILKLGETKPYPNPNAGTYTEWTMLYFKKDNEQTKLFLVSRRGGIENYGNAQNIYSTNKSAITEIMGVRPRELSGKYDYYNSGSRSANAFVSIWEKNNERVVLHIADAIGNPGGFMYFSIPLWNEYENLCIAKQRAVENASKEAAKNNF